MLNVYKKLPVFSALLVVVLIFGACGRGRVDEDLLPTAVPTLGIEAANLPTEVPPTVAATATEEPVVPTNTATEVPTEAATATEEVVASQAQPESPLAAAEIEATSEPTATATLEVSVTLTPTATSTATVEPTVAATITPTLMATATLVTTATVPITAVQAITLTKPVTPAKSLTTTQEMTGSTTITNSESFGDLPEGVAAALKKGDVANGQLLTQKNACIGCHSLDEGVKLVGPSWYGLADKAGTRVEGQDAEIYLYHSIVNPNEYVVEGYAAGLMLQTYRETLSDQDFADIISFLMTLKAK